MLLDRNVNLDGKGKYALVRLREIETGSEAHALLLRLYELGCLDWGSRGKDDEFFVIKLKDQFSAPALEAYADAALDEAKSKEDELWSYQVRGLAERAKSHASKKYPD